jgi:hypothetical protein
MHTRPCAHPTPPGQATATHTNKIPAYKIGQENVRTAMQRARRLNEHWGILGPSRTFPQRVRRIIASSYATPGWYLNVGGIPTLDDITSLTLLDEEVAGLALGIRDSQIREVTFDGMREGAMEAETLTFTRKPPQKVEPVSLPLHSRCMKLRPGYIPAALLESASPPADVLPRIGDTLKSLAARQGASSYLDIQTPNRAAGGRADGGSINAYERSRQAMRRSLSISPSNAHTQHPRDQLPPTHELYVYTQQ